MKDDLAAHVRDCLGGGASLGALASDHAPLDAVVREYQSRHGTAVADELSRGVAACLSDEDASVRAQALIFFEKFPEAAGGEELTKILEKRPELFAGVPNPWASGSDLEWQLLRSIGARILRRDQAALAVGYAAALEPGRAQPLIAALTSSDPDWVAAHAEEIARINPEAGAALLINLQRTRDVAAIGEKIAPLASRDPKFREYVELFISDDETKRRILAAIR